MRNYSVHSKYERHRNSFSGNQTTYVDHQPIKQSITMKVEELEENLMRRDRAPRQPYFDKQGATAKSQQEEEASRKTAKEKQSSVAQRLNNH